MKKFIIEIKDKVLRGEAISMAEALRMINLDEKDTLALEALFEGANEIRMKYAGSKADLCSIVNAKSGHCTEDCKYCAQSAHHNTGIQEYGLLGYEEILEKALEAQRQGVHRFSLVTSGRGIESEEELNKLVEIYSRLRKDASLKLCASHGIIDNNQAVQLRAAGVSMYHHNVETSSRHYGNICTTNTYQDRLDTIRNVREAGLEVCCGGIIGMEETHEDRVKMAFEIKALEVTSIPVNVLNPIKGTPLEDLELSRQAPFSSIPADAIKCF